jgi:hypothetical protein
VLRNGWHWLCVASRKHPPRQKGLWWIGWVEDVPGVNAQERTREGLLVSLKAVLQEALEMNRAEARAAAGSSYEELALAL